MELKKAIALRLQQLMEEKGETTASLAQKTELPETTVKNILACRHKRVELHRVFILSYALGLSLQAFFQDGVFDSVTER